MEGEVAETVPRGQLDAYIYLQSICRQQNGSSLVFVNLFALIRPRVEQNGASWLNLVSGH